MEHNDLLKLASAVKENAYAPYSGFRVGAAVLMESGRVFTGVNIENASYGATCCAERTAIFKAVSERDTVIRAIAIASDSEEFVYPCGICRQVIAEFGNEDTKVICGRKNGEFRVHTLDEILPHAFKKLSEK